MIPSCASRPIGILFLKFSSPSASLEEETRICNHGCLVGSWRPVVLGALSERLPCSESSTSVRGSTSPAVFFFSFSLNKFFSLSLSLTHTYKYSGFTFSFFWLHITNNSKHITTTYLPTYLERISLFPLVFIACVFGGFSIPCWTRR